MPGVRRQALRRKGFVCPVEREKYFRYTVAFRGRGDGDVCRRTQVGGAAAHVVRCGVGLFGVGANAHDIVRRRRPASEAGKGTDGAGTEQCIVFNG